LKLSREDVEAVAAEETEELARRERAYRDDLPPPAVQGKTAILVDDGLATGASMRAAVAALRRLGPARVIVAVPVAAASTRDEFGRLVDEVVCARTPSPFLAVGLWYDDFSQTSDEEVRELLRRAEEDLRARPSSPT
jgi:predicted phosphoribosyltransferase